LPDALDAFYAHPVDPEKIVVMWLGNGVGEWSGYGSSGILLKTDSRVVLLDPADIVSGTNVQKLQRLDALLVTHEHTDHFSKSATISIQSRTDAVVVCNSGVYTQLDGSLPFDKLVRMRSGEARTILDIEILAMASIHLGNEPLTFLLLFGDFSVFHGSDSGFNSDLNNYKGRAKLALVPTGGASPTASPEEAVKMVKTLEPTDVIPMHGTEPQNARLGDLLAQQSPNVRYLRPQALSSLVVNEFYGVGFLALLASVSAFSCARRLQRHERR